MDALLPVLSPMSEWVSTITYDNGREFSGHMHVAAELDYDSYFAQPLPRHRDVVHHDGRQPLNHPLKGDCQSNCGHSSQDE